MKNLNLIEFVDEKRFFRYKIKFFRAFDFAEIRGFWRYCWTIAIIFGDRSNRNDVTSVGDTLNWFKIFIEDSCVVENPGQVLINFGVQGSFGKNGVIL